MDQLVPLFLVTVAELLLLVTITNSPLPYATAPPLTTAGNVVGVQTVPFADVAAICPLDTAPPEVPFIGTIMKIPLPNAMSDQALLAYAGCVVQDVP